MSQDRKTICIFTRDAYNIVFIYPPLKGAGEANIGIATLLAMAMEKREGVPFEQVIIIITVVIRVKIIISSLLASSILIVTINCFVIL